MEEEDLQDLPYFKILLITAHIPCVFQGTEKVRVVHIYMYTYRERERDGGRERESVCALVRYISQYLPSEMNLFHHVQSTAI